MIEKFKIGKGRKIGMWREKLQCNIKCSLTNAVFIYFTRLHHSCPKIRKQLVIKFGFRFRNKGYVLRQYRPPCEDDRMCVF
jgi:hypothetical protein